jgi:hypothetical protein
VVQSRYPLSTKNLMKCTVSGSVFGGALLVPRSLIETTIFARIIVYSFRNAGVQGRCRWEASRFRQNEVVAAPAALGTPSRRPRSKGRGAEHCA